MFPDTTTGDPVKAKQMSSILTRSFKACGLGGLTSRLARSAFLTWAKDNHVTEEEEKGLAYMSVRRPPRRRTAPLLPTRSLLTVVARCKTSA